MKREVLSIIFNQCRKNKITIIILLMLFCVCLVFSPFISRFIGNTSFYISNDNYKILLSKTTTHSEKEYYFVNNDYLLQKNNQIINAQCIMLKDSSANNVFKIPTLAKNEIVITKSIALYNSIKVGDTLNVDINYNHNIVSYQVVGICDYLFDISQDTNILSSPIFFVGYDEDYINNSIVTYLSFLDNSVEIQNIVDLSNIISLYDCKSRAVLNTFILSVLILFNCLSIFIGYYIFSKCIDKKSVFIKIRHSGVNYKRYINFVFMTILLSTLLFCIPIVVSSLIAGIIFIKYLYCLLLFMLLMICSCIIETIIYKKRFNYLGEKR